MTGNQHVAARPDHVVLQTRSPKDGARAIHRPALHECRRIERGACEVVERSLGHPTQPVAFGEDRLHSLIGVVDFDGAAGDHRDLTTRQERAERRPAGEQFVDPVEPFRMIAGSLLVAVPTVLLIRSGWSRVGRTRLEGGSERSVE